VTADGRPIMIPDRRSDVVATTHCGDLVFPAVFRNGWASYDGLSKAVWIVAG